MTERKLGLWKIGEERSGSAGAAHFRPVGRRDPQGRRFPSKLYNGAVALVIREYKTEDFESLWRMDQKCFPPGISYSKRELRAFVRHRGSFTLVAVNEKEELQGFIVAHCGASGHVITIDVGPETRRSGVGSLLLGSAEKRMRAAGCIYVGLEAAVDNTVALAFYKRHGYDVIRTWPRYYSNGVDALVLKKDLNGS
ncbi:MAG TPA: N-acetyltransferase [Candidatus Binatia bacterium]|nr:N-acetyltransferase [Candidatus Binatia bacterium]